MQRFYVPILKWKQGEYMALSRLDDDIKAKIIPLLEVPVIGFDFAANKVAKTLDEHLSLFPKRYTKHWGKGRAFIDTALVERDKGQNIQYLNDGRRAIKFIFDSIQEGHDAVPVTGITRDEEYQSIVKNIISTRNSGVCIRIGLDDLFGDGIAALLLRLDVECEKCDLILDLGSPNFSDIQSLAQMIDASVSEFRQLGNWHSMSVCGTAFPENLSGLKMGGGIISREEWLLFSALFKKMGGEKVPNFGDYGISHPIAPEGDMRKWSPAASIRYTLDTEWFVAKGMRVRPSPSDKKKQSENEDFEFEGGYGQFQELCGLVKKQQRFSGETFSAGDKYINGCAAGKEKTGNLTTWRWVGNNHHITKVVRDLAAMKFFS